MLEAKRIDCPKGRFSLDIMGRLKNVSTGQYVQPFKGAKTYGYQQLKGGHVELQMSRTWPGLEFAATPEWFAAAREAALITQIMKRSIKGKRRVELDTKKQLPHWGTSIQTPPALTWKQHARIPKIEISSTGLVRRKDKPEQSYYPTLTKQGHPLVRLSRMGLKGSVWLSMAYQELFLCPLPGFEDMEERQSRSEFKMSCPYSRGMIETLYGSGKPDAQFSPLDWFHEHQPEAVKVRLQ